MPKGKQNTARQPVTSERGRKNRNFPKHTLEQALVLAQKIQDEMGGQPMNRLLLAEAIGLSPSSTNFRDLLSSAYKYGLTDGTEKADSISLTQTGVATTEHADQGSRLKALRTSALTPALFGLFFRNYANKRLPSPEILPKVLSTQYDVPSGTADECSSMIASNGRYVDIVRDIGGSPHVLLEPSGPAQSSEPSEENFTSPGSATQTTSYVAPETTPPQPYMSSSPTGATGPKPIFVGHGKNKVPLQQLQRLLSTFQIPHKVVVDEANLGRPIPQKVKETIEECGSAILIFTRDEKLFDENGKEIWRPSENVVHELGATSLAYGDRIVIFKEKGLHFPTNFQSIGYIEFEAEDLQARTADLLKELIGFGLVRVTPT
jgi:predicted nucleotide-binding protein